MKSNLKAIKDLGKKRNNETISGCLALLKKNSRHHFDYKTFDLNSCHLYLKDDTFSDSLILDDGHGNSIEEFQTDSPIKKYQHFTFPDFQSVHISTFVQQKLIGEKMIKCRKRNGDIKFDVLQKYLKKVAEDFLTSGIISNTPDCFLIADNLHGILLKAIEKFSLNESKLS